MQHENVIRWFQDTAERRGDEPCLRFKKARIWKSLSWTNTLKMITEYSEALKKLGIGPEDRVALISNTRYEWTIIDMAILSLGAVTVPIYHSNLAEDIRLILKDSGAKVIFAEDSTQLEKILKVRSDAPDLKDIIVMEGKVMGEGLTTLHDFHHSGKGVESDFGIRIRGIRSNDLATLVYTSGTTGVPKGVMLTHGNILGELDALKDVLNIPINSELLAFLPLAHILARVLQFYQLVKGFTNSYAESIEKLVDNIGEIRPHLMICVPRIFEKIYQKMLAGVESGSPAKKKIFYWARGIGKEYSTLICAKQSIPFGLKIKYAIATKLVFSKLQAKLGGRIIYFISGGAPLAAEIAEFFHGAGILILEGYGLTETAAGLNINLPNDYVFGTVGRPLAGVEEKIAKDGEIMARGSMIFKGYWNKPNETAEVLEDDGWFHTGDIGEFLPSGHLRITDRKKDIIVTAGGKNIAPQKIENIIKTDPLISQVVVHGDRRKFLSALITLDPEALVAKGKDLGLNKKGHGALSRDPKIYDIVKAVIDENNKKFAKYETIKRFSIIEKDFTVEGGELTPTMKVKRKVINERYKNELDSMYSD